MAKSIRSRALLGAAAAALAPTALLSTAVIAPASAQDYTSGGVNGTVTDSSGNPVAGATVTITSQDRGISRSTTTSSTGGYRFSGLSIGSYDVTAASGGQSQTIEGVRVTQSTTSSADLRLGTGDTLVVTGTQQNLDFTSTTTGVNVNVPDLVKDIPIGRNLTAVTLLAPGTSLGDSAFGNLASVGGSSVAENAYYVNGLNTTNFDNYLASARVPFEFYQSVDIKTGGYQAEFGRATGGVINAVTKQGTNDFMAAIHLNWTPNFLRGDLANEESCSYDSAVPGSYTGGSLPSISCTPTTHRESDETDSYSAIIEAGGPIIEDRIFLYGLLELRETRSITNDALGGTSFGRKNNDPFWGAKLDVIPWDDHRFEFTMFDTRNTTVRNDNAYSYDPATDTDTFGTAKSVNEFTFGGLNYVAKYTGNWNEWLTMSASYGRMRDNFEQFGTAGGASFARVANFSGATVGGIPDGGNGTAQTVSSRSFPYNTQRKFWRADADMFFDFFGDHHVRMGFDLEKNTLNRATVRTGGDFLFGNGYLTSDAYDFGFGGAGLIYILRTPTEVELNYFNSSGAFDAKNTAYYIQDEWQVTDQLTVNLGVRRDDFRVFSSTGDSLVSQKGNYAPRVGFSYDVLGDGRGKLFGSYGWYYLPFASNTSFRMTGSEVYFRERWMFSGFDANGIPVLTTQVGGTSPYTGPCPFGLTPASSGAGTSVCSVTGDGTVIPPDAAIAQNLGATKQTEIIVGYEHQLTDLWTLGLAYTHRNLNRTAEDAAIDKAVLDYCDREGITGCSSTWTGFHQYTIINPGQEAVVVLDGLDGRTVTFSGSELGYPEAKRSFDAVEFTFERAFDGRWSVRGSYQWSESEGNSEGFVQSDFGQDDAGITQDFDQPTFTDGAYGLLPNHRRHRIKIWGSYALTDEFRVGTNMQFASPRPLSCLGYHPAEGGIAAAPYGNFGNLYGAASHYCGGVISPRGTAQETDWLIQVDLSARYNIEIPSGQEVTFRVDAFNVFNRQGVTERVETGDLRHPLFNGDTVPVPDPNFGVPLTYQAARSVRLGMDISF